MAVTANENRWAGSLNPFNIREAGQTLMGIQVTSHKVVSIPSTSGKPVRPKEFGRTCY